MSTHADRVADIFMECARVDLTRDALLDSQIGRLGINSIDLVAIVSRLEKEFGISFEEMIFTERLESVRDFVRVVGIAARRTAPLTGPAEGVP